MKSVKDIKGLKYPDEALTRFFFKHGHDKRCGRVLELGCGNGNNLMLYDAYGWEVVGVDISEASLRDAASNLEGRGKLLQHDLTSGIPAEVEAAEYDVLLLANVLCYLPREAASNCVHALARTTKGECGVDVYLRTHQIDDYRYGRGKEVERNGFVLNITQTGEQGMLMVLYTQSELMHLLQDAFGGSPSDWTLLQYSFDNVQSGHLIPCNSDIVIWGNNIHQHA